MCTSDSEVQKDDSVKALAITDSLRRERERKKKICGGASFEQCEAVSLLSVDKATPQQEFGKGPKPVQFCFDLPFSSVIAVYGLATTPSTNNEVAKQLLFLPVLF